MKHPFMPSIWWLPLCLLLMAPNLAYGEVYKDIGPFDTLGDLKAKFPRAEFEQTYPAWAKESDAMYHISGEGLSGMIVVNFNDNRPLLRERLSNFIAEKDRRQDPEIQEKVAAIQKTSDHSDPTTYSSADLERTISTFQKCADENDEEALTVGWVRWVPDSLIPLKRFITKYGKPDKSGILDDNMEPYKSWNRGLIAHLSDDGKKVLMVDYSFTQEEKALAWPIKYPNFKYNPYKKISKPKPKPSKKKK